MAKGLRSKSRQRVLAVTRKKYKELDRQKAWAHYLRTQAQQSAEMDCATAEGGDSEPGDMQTDKTKVTKKAVKRWSVSQSQKNKLKRLVKHRHTKW